MISWLAFSLAVIGAFLCARERKVAFYWLGTSNVVWVIIGLLTDQWALATQQAIFFFLAIYSYRKWSKKTATWPTPKEKDSFVKHGAWASLVARADEMSESKRRAYLYGEFRVTQPDFVPGNDGYDRIGDGVSEPWHCNCSWDSKAHGNECPEHGTPAKVYAGYKISQPTLVGGGNVTKVCGFVPPTPGYAGCTREAGHDGPCAHALSNPPLPGEGTWGKL